MRRSARERVTTPKAQQHNQEERVANDKKELRKLLREEFVQKHGREPTASETTQLWLNAEARYDGTRTQHTHRTSAQNNAKVQDQTQRNKRRKEAANAHVADDDELARAAGDFPTPVEEARALECVREALAAFAWNSVGVTPCATCGMMVDVSHVSTFDTAYFLATYADAARSSASTPKFWCLEQLWSEHPKLAGLMLEKKGCVYDDGNDVTHLQVCHECVKDAQKAALTGGGAPTRFLSNGNYFGRLPEAFADLTLAEQIASGTLRNTVCNVRLTGGWQNHGETAQRAFVGTTTFMEQEPSALLDLPLSPGQVVERLRVVFLGPNQPLPGVISRVCSVRPEILRELLTFYKNSGGLEKAVVIRDQVLEQYPADGSVAPELVYAVTHTVEDGAQERQGYVPRFSQDENANNVSQDESEVPIVLERAALTVQDDFLVSQPDLLEVANMVAHAPRNTMGSQSDLLEEAPAREDAPGATEGAHAMDPGGGDARGNVMQEVNVIAAFRAIGWAPFNGDISADMVRAYRHLFPFGVGAVSDERARPISFSFWIQRCLRAASGDFESDERFLFGLLDKIRQSKVLSRARFKMEAGFFERLSTHLGDTVAVKEAVLLALALMNKKQEEADRLIAKGVDVKVANLVLSNVKLVSTGTQGTFFARTLNGHEMTALCVDRGPPTFFMTINHADTHNPVVCVRAAAMSDVQSRIASDLPTPLERARIVASRPVAVADAFNCMVTVLLERLFGFDVKHQRSRKGGGVLGYVDWYYFVLETQQRGSLHMHGLVRIVGMPGVADLKEKLADPEYAARFCRYVNSVISCCMPFGDGGSQFEKFAPPKELLEELAAHDATYSSTRVNESAKRSFTPGSDESARFGNVDLYQLVVGSQLHQHTATCFKKGEYCRFQFPRRRFAETHFSEEGFFLRLARNHPWINSYNPHIMHLLRSNHDLRILGTGKDAFLSIQYVIKYASKQPLPACNVWATIAEFLAKPYVAPALEGKVTRGMS